MVAEAHHGKLQSVFGRTPLVLRLGDVLQLRPANSLSLETESFLFKSAIVLSVFFSLSTKESSEDSELFLRALDAFVDVS